MLIHITDLLNVAAGDDEKENEIGAPGHRRLPGVYQA